MAYNYFSAQLLKSDLDLNAVFPLVQESAKNQENLGYGLPEVVSYIKDATNNFKLSDARMIDLDSGVRDVVDRYYISIDQKNPFVSDITSTPTFAVYEKGTKPRDAVSVPKTEKEEVKETKEESIQQKAEDVLMAKIESFKKELAGRQFLIDESDPEEKEDIMSKIKKRFIGTEIMIEEGDADEFDKARYELLKEFIAKNS
jgi:hypothetical protein